METKASYIVVGLSALIAVALFFGMLLFAVNKEDGQKVTYYKVIFEGGVSGLSVGNDVRFNGIKVGEVRQIDIDPNDPARVRVIASVHGEVPIREDSEARLEAQGITGLSIVYISGGNAKSPILMPKGEDEIAEIKSTKSAIGQVMDRAPDIVESANELLRRGVSILSPQNEKALAETLESLAVMSAKMEAQAVELETAIANLGGASGDIKSILANADRLFSTDFPDALHTFQRTFARLDAILAKAEPGIDRLTAGVVEELHRTLSDASILIRNINQLVQRLNSDPQMLLRGNNVPAYQVK
ncbi:MlaD family protein [Desulfovibrio sp. OttesenSCG-928-F07]|nr:MlaD family protein [Desulfovibrio sp. OttesenSCG-928-F07]